MGHALACPPTTTESCVGTHSTPPPQRTPPEEPQQTPRHNLSFGRPPTPLCPAQVRNHILARWRHDPTQLLTREAAAARINERFAALIGPAWDFLDS